MRSLARALSLMMTVAFLAAPGWAQQAPYACGPGGCPPGGCGNGTCCPPYPRYCGYGVSSSNYYQAPPPHMLGGPAYGYTFPYPWGPCCPAPKSYIAPAYPSYYYYPFPYGAQYGGQSHSYYAGYPQYYGQGGTTGTVFATERVKPAAPAPASPAKASSTSAKLPDTASSKKALPPASTDAAKKPNFLQRLLFWQKS